MKHRFLMLFLLLLLAGCGLNNVNPSESSEHSEHSEQTSSEEISNSQEESVSTSTTHIGLPPIVVG